jgi:hypothetical protein
MNANTYRTKLTRNILSRVARKLGLSRSHLCLVSNGHRRSRRVEAALAREYELIERRVRRFASKTERRAA